MLTRIVSVMTMYSFIRKVQYAQLLRFLQVY